jgi:hypothetical protein
MAKPFPFADSNTQEACLQFEGLSAAMLLGGVSSAVYNAHAPATDLFKDAIVRDGLPDQ